MKDKIVVRPPKGYKIALSSGGILFTRLGVGLKCEEDKWEDLVITGLYLIGNGGSGSWWAKLKFAIVTLLYRWEFRAAEGLHRGAGLSLEVVKEAELADIMKLDK